MQVGAALFSSAMSVATALWQSNSCAEIRSFDDVAAGLPRTSRTMWTACEDGSLTLWRWPATAVGFHGGGPFDTEVAAVAGIWAWD